MKWDGQENMAENQTQWIRHKIRPEQQKGQLYWIKPKCWKGAAASLNHSLCLEKGGSNFVPELTLFSVIEKKTMDLGAGIQASPETYSFTHACHNRCSPFPGIASQSPSK